MLHRLFAAIRPPAIVIERLLAMGGGVAGARWQDAGQLHLTLRFFGELRVQEAEDLVTALEGVSASPFAMRLRGLGHFEKKGRTHTLWAGVVPSPALLELKRRVEGAARRAGLTAKRRAFVPHVTLARLNSASGSPLPFLQAESEFQSKPWRVDAFDLMESTLTPDGAQYETVRRYRLTS